MKKNQGLSKFPDKIWSIFLLKISCKYILHLDFRHLTFVFSAEVVWKADKKFKHLPYVETFVKRFTENPHKFCNWTLF